MDAEDPSVYLLFYLEIDIKKLIVVMIFPTFYLAYLSLLLEEIYKKKPLVWYEYAYNTFRD